MWERAEENVGLKRTFQYSDTLILKSVVLRTVFLAYSYLKECTELRSIFFIIFNFLCDNVILKVGCMDYTKKILLTWYIAVLNVMLDSFMKAL